MKKLHILALVLVAVLIGWLVVMIGNFTQYATFGSHLATAGKEVSIVGTLDLSKPMEYDPIKDPNKFTFYLVDDSLKCNRVIYNKEKPTDFEKAEKVVVKGRMKEGTFYAKEILMKCPSKYKEQAAKAE